VEEARAEGTLSRYYSPAPRPGDSLGTRVAPKTVPWVLAYTPARFRPDLRTALAAEFFDRAVARRLSRTEVFTGFSGQALDSARAARRLGSEVVTLESPTGHVRLVWRQQRRAETSRIERGWLSARTFNRALLEYELADTIYVTSSYAYDSFLAEGVPERKLRRRTLSIHDRFVPRSDRSQDGTFRVVYVGALTATKGVHVLLEAFERLAAQSAELTLVGGWASRGMRIFIAERLRSDPRIHVTVGDPLPHLQRADVYVQPSFHDGFGFAPMEALACGVPVIVTEDTGMREHVREGVNGFVIPTGNVDALVQRLDFLRAHPLVFEAPRGSTRGSTPLAR
jgi:glycosyltransferase involved in cell wall biosynthesis